MPGTSLACWLIAGTSQPHAVLLEALHLLRRSSNASCFVVCQFEYSLSKPFLLSTIRTLLSVSLTTWRTRPSDAGFRKKTCCGEPRLGRSGCWLIAGRWLIAGLFRTTDDPSRMPARIVSFSVSFNLRFPSKFATAMRACTAGFPKDLTP